MRYWVPFTKTYNKKCKDGSTRLVYRNIDSAFPLFVQGWDGSLSASIKAEQNIDATLKGEVKTKIDNILVALDQHNNSLMMDFRAAYLIYSSEPCEKLDYLQRMVDKIISRRNFIRDRKLMLDSLIALAKEGKHNTGEFLALFGKIVLDLLPETAVDATISEMKVAQFLAIEMRRKKDEE